ncbi:cytochrome b/b6 domain-containing protein [Poseidonibacter sp.]|uniref:cytochrome b/b6 domain-containing protein n=1 Tax=Poseidonibacter sp. TaxID=2321188 RepID=UPI00359E638F
MKKSYIWSLPTRVFHWLFVLFILLAFISAEEDFWLDYHAIIGYAVLILLFYRVIWGFFGPKYSLFKDFPIGIQNAKDFLSNIFEKQEKYIGHNPLASYVMFSMFIICFLVIISGILAYGIQEGKGIVSFLNSSFFKEMELFEELHELLSTLFIVLIVAHIFGVFMEWFLHSPNETLNSIFTGFKKTKNDESVKLNIYQKVFSFIMLLFFIGFLLFNVYKPNNILIASKYEEINYESKNELFVNECASCHTLYSSKFIAC